jgi:tetratricopeptide (TPR) repeat protein
LRAQHLHGPIYNDIQFGGFLIGHLWPGERVFIDGRLEVYGDAVYAQYLAINAGPGWPEMVRRYHPNLVLIPYASERMMQRLYRDPDWALVDVDGVAALFARRTADHQAAVSAAEERWRRLNVATPIDREVLTPGPVRPWLARLLGRRRFPFESWGRGNAMAILQLFEAARREYGQAMRDSNYEEPVVIKNYALASLYTGRRAEAAAWYRRLLELDPSNREARATLSRLEGG